MNAANPHLLRPDPSAPVRLSVTPATAGWTYLSFAVVDLGPGERHEQRLDDQETAIVPLRGSATVRVGDVSDRIARTDVFEEMPRIAYAPPGAAVEVTADDRFEFAVGSAPAEGIYPARIVEPGEMKSEIRGGGAARRQVNHVLAPRSTPSA